jgi:tRNA (cmo5U34)-methyltransferase
MEGDEYMNTSPWTSDRITRQWLADQEERERKRAPQWRLMGELLPFDESDSFVFLDLGAGTGAAARALLDLYPQSSAILADLSPQIMDEGVRAMEPYNGRFRYVEFDMLAEHWSPAIPASLDAVITSQCIHHLPDERKQSVFAEILGRLAPGSWYINFDPVTSGDPTVAAAWQRANDRQDPKSITKRTNRTPEEQENYENHVRYMVPLVRQVDYLRLAGFEAVDVYWKHLDYVIYGGRRPLTDCR